MANPSSSATGVADKPYSHLSRSEPPFLQDGLVHHTLVTASIQVQILSIVDETGSASIGDIVVALSDHPDPVAAILVMVDLQILVVEIDGILDANSIVRRATPEPDPHGAGDRPRDPHNPNTFRDAALPSKDRADLPRGLERLQVSPFLPQVVVGAGEARRAFARLSGLHRPGIYGLINGTSIYVGMGSDVAARVAGGQQPIEQVDTVFVLTDANDNLSIDDAKVAERILWSRVAAARQRTLVNGVPDGAPAEPQRYSELETFVAQACLALRHHDVSFTTGSARGVLAGPRHEPGRVGPWRLLNDIPSGEVFELSFGEGLVAMAARQRENRWVLLQGSEVRIDAVASANASARFLRAAWLHSGLLAPAADGRSYLVQRDLVFASGSATAQFCTGSKGKGLAGWQPIDPEGGFDPQTAALIAS